MLVCAFLVAFFPILSNTALGLAAVGPQSASNLFELYRRHALASNCCWLRLPSALPYFLGGLRIGGGLVADRRHRGGDRGGVRGFGIGPRLPHRGDRGIRLNIPRMFAALFLISITGILRSIVFFTALSWLLLHRWHDSARSRET